jgi:CHAT domain-containing protein
VVRIPAGRRQLGDEVAIFRSLLLRGRDAPVVEEALLAQGRRLYTLLVAPAAPAIAGAGRVLISPDGPLHILPFSALVRPGPAPSYLAAWKPIHTVLSATLAAELQRGRRERRDPGPLVIFADPLYRRPAPGAARASGQPPLALYRQGLLPLSGAREEARSLARLYGGGTRVYTGALATEEQAKHLPAAPRVLHFATHALLDLRSPLDSALALAAPGPGSQENGLLQAWEIFEQVRLDADLVTLSACETGLGRDAAGEGLIGLTRAFQYAGARSVLASLWAVSDRSTAELMERFYTLLRAGRPKDAALAEAQRELINSGGPFAHPYHWAAFELTGDWK